MLDGPPQGRWGRGASGQQRGATRIYSRLTPPDRSTVRCTWLISGSDRVEHRLDFAAPPGRRMSSAFALTVLAQPQHVGTVSQVGRTPAVTSPRRRPRNRDCRSKCARFRTRAWAHQRVRERHLTASACAAAELANSANANFKEPHARDFDPQHCGYRRAVRASL
jgi:hypothetical protein